LNPKRNILLLTHRVPYPPNRGDRIRAYHSLRYLSRQGNVWLGALADEPVEPGVKEHLQQLCREVALVPLAQQRRWVNAAWSLLGGETATAGLFRSSQLRGVVRQWTASTQFDAVVIFCSSMAQYLDAADAARANIIVDLVDVDSEKWFDYAKNARGPKRWLYLLEARRVRRLEQALARRANALTVVTEPEAQLLRSFCSAAEIHAVGNGVDTDYFHPGAAGRPAEPLHAVFVGVLDYHANVDGLCWFCENVWPQVKISLPEATFSIVGRRPTPTVRQLQRFPGINVVGEVDDVRDHLARATVSIAPLRIARGVQNKVLEAMAAGVPVLASPQALTGLELQPGRDALCAQTPADWHSQLVRLLTGDALRSELAARGRAYVERHHSWQRQLAQLGDLINATRSAGSTATAPADHHDLQPAVAHS